MPGGTRKQISTLSTLLGKKLKPANMLASTNMETNMEDIITLVLEKQQNVLESVVHNAMKGALSEINNSLQQIHAELETQGSVCELVQCMDKTQVETREIKKSVNACTS